MIPRQMTPRLRFAPLAAALCLCALPVLAQQPAPVVAKDVWSRATAPRQSAGAVYMTLTSAQGDRLTGAASPAAEHVSIHEMAMDGNVMRMRQVEGGLELPAGTPVALKPGGYHVMLEGLKAPLKAGDSLPVTLTFQKAPPLTVQATVRAVGSPGMKPMH